jgi:hypothetical protein
MKTAILNRPKYGQRLVLTVAPRKYSFLISLLRNFDFVQIEQEEYDGDSREEIIANLKGVAEDLRLLKAGKLETRPLKDFLNEL